MKLTRGDGRHARLRPRGHRRQAEAVAAPGEHAAVALERHGMAGTRRDGRHAQ